MRRVNYVDSGCLGARQFGRSTSLGKLVFLPKVEAVLLDHRVG